MTKTIENVYLGASALGRLITTHQKMDGKVGHGIAKTLKTLQTDDHLGMRVDIIVREHVSHSDYVKSLATSTPKGVSNMDADTKKLLRALIEKLG